MYDGFSAPDTIDLITHEPNDVFVLIIVHSGEWVGSRQEEDALLVKINDYLHFVLNGEFHMRYPQAIGKEVRVQVDTGSDPPLEITNLVQQADAKLMERNIRIQINLLK